MKKVTAGAFLAFFLSGCEAPFEGGNSSGFSFPIPDGYFEEMARCKDLEPGSPDMNSFDVGPSLHEQGRPAEWKSQHTYLGNTCLTAAIGPGIYQDEPDEIPDYYSIDVEIRQVEKNAGVANEYRLVLYQRDFRIEDLPEDFLKKSINEVVSYDSVARKVIFHMGDVVYEYKLP